VAVDFATRDSATALVAGVRLAAVFLVALAGGFLGRASLLREPEADRLSDSCGHCARRAQVDDRGCRRRLLRLARQAVPPIGTTQDAKGILVTVFGCIDGDAHDTHSQTFDPRARDHATALGTTAVAG
jgi:hypothetical protein